MSREREAILGALRHRFAVDFGLPGVEDVTLDASEYQLAVDGQVVNLGTVDELLEWGAVRTRVHEQTDVVMRVPGSGISTPIDWLTTAGLVLALTGGVE